MNTPKNLPPPVDLPSEEEYEEFLEWTVEEEEEFLRILNDPGTDVIDT